MNALQSSTTPRIVTLVRSEADGQYYSKLPLTHKKGRHISMPASEAKKCLTETIAHLNRLIFTTTEFKNRL